MTYVTLLSEGTRKAAKQHQCFDCYQPIVKGTVHRFATCKYDDVYTIRQHQDCSKASEFYMKFHGLRPWDFDIEGIPPLADMISDCGEFKTDCDMLRGHFPHVVARLELANENAFFRKNRRREASQ